MNCSLHLFAAAIDEFNTLIQAFKVNHTWFLYNNFLLFHKLIAWFRKAKLLCDPNSQ